MYALGQKYDIRSLQEAALQNFARALEYAWNHPDFVKVIVMVWQRDDSADLREEVAKAIQTHKAALCEKPEVVELLGRTKALAYSLWARTDPKVSARGETGRMRCLSRRERLEQGQETYCEDCSG